MGEFKNNKQIPIACTLNKSSTKHNYFCASNTIVFVLQIFAVLGNPLRLILIGQPDHVAIIFKHISDWSIKTSIICTYARSRQNVVFTDYYALASLQNPTISSF